MVWHPIMEWDYSAAFSMKLSSNTLVNLATNGPLFATFIGHSDPTCARTYSLYNSIENISCSRWMMNSWIVVTKQSTTTAHWIEKIKKRTQRMHNNSKEQFDDINGKRNEILLTHSHCLHCIAVCAMCYAYSFCSIAVACRFSIVEVSLWNDFHIVLYIRETVVSQTDSIRLLLNVIFSTRYVIQDITTNSTKRYGKHENEFLIEYELGTQ